MSSGRAPRPVRSRTNVVPAAPRVPGVRSAELSHRPELPVVWEVLSSVMRRQLDHDALLLWRYERQRGVVRLLAATPEPSMPQEAAFVADEPLHRLAGEGLDLLVQPMAATDEGPASALLARLNVRAAVTVVVGQEGNDTHLLTVGFRQRWGLVAHHCQAVTAFAAYLRHCGQTILPPSLECQWWRRQSQATRLWHRDYRPSALRTVHDLGEVLLDARRPNLTLGPPVATAHRAADLLDRLEAVYGLAPAAYDEAELLSQALLLTQRAFELCRGRWAGGACLGGPPDDPLPRDPAARRHCLIDWPAGRFETPIAA